MDTIVRWRKCSLLLLYFLVFSITCSREPSSGNGVSEMKRHFAVSGQRMLPSWHHPSIDTVPEHHTVSLHSHNRWQSRMAFSKPVHFEVKEDTAPGTVVGKLETDFEALTPITYSVQEDDGDNPFLFSPLSGEFLLSRSLDFEKQSLYVVTVVVQQGDSRVSSVRVYFNVLDVNDNPPVFGPHTFSASLLEDTRVGTCFLSLNVSDKDDAVNGDLELRVVGGDEGEVFSINPSGSLCLNTALDRERQPFYNLTVTANDCARPRSSQFTSTAHLVVVVEDVNDNVPVFVSARTLTIQEDAVLHSVVMTAHAKDEDIGANGEVLYYLNSTSGGKFSIDNNSGKIYLEEALDREREDTLTITLTATDRGSPKMTTTMDLRVDIEDVNDHYPEFPESTYNLTIPENIPRGTSLLQVQAHDRDAGMNGQVRYTLTPASPFAVDAVRGVITVMDKLDREKDPSYTLFVRAVDLGIRPRSATTAVSVTVLDVNDCAPVFTPDTLVMHVMENEEDPSRLTHQVSATDEDSGINSHLTYFIQRINNDGLFSITPGGTFQILHRLDRERESLYFLNIIAVDSGVPPLTGTLSVHVVVDDVNDNRPEFTEDAYTTVVSEDIPIGTVFAMITASDIDEGVSGEIRYSMENPDVPFAIDETSGELFTTDVLDRETAAMYRLMVICNDRHPTEPLSSSVLVIVLVGDINDHWPRFMDSPYVAYVPTEMRPGSIVCAVRAEDGDTELNAELQYSLHGENSDLFSVNSYSGIVFTSSTLQRTEDLVVHAQVEDAGDDPKSDNTSISIRFQSASEFPEMNVDLPSHSLSEDEAVGTLVAAVSAASVRAEPVSFFLAYGNFENTFHVGQLNGALTVENPLDHESRRDFTLLMEARDSGSPPFSSFAEIHINISDVNDNYPQFTQAEYRCEVFENSPPSWVCDVLAIDADSGSYGTVLYGITEGNTDNSFTIDPENGLLHTNVSLDRESIPEFNLTVEAVELNNPLRKDRAFVLIVVLDRNDNAPRFSQIFLTEISEDSPVGRVVLKVSATDDDTGVNAVINYTILDKSGVTPFNIDFATGYVTVERPLDREVQDLYIVKVKANDSAWSISTDVTIVLADVNDNRPVFSDPFYTVVLPETEDDEVFVMQVLATDADTGRNGDILYVIEPPNEEFWLNASSGEIYTKQPLMVHNSASEIYQFTVMAFDCGSVPLYSNVTVTVRLEPYNYHPPVFLPFQSLIAIPYYMTVGTEVLQLTAIDQDVNNSSVGIGYVLNGGNASDFFWIHADNGKVTLHQNVEASLNLSLTLFVMARDRGFPPLSSRTEIAFEITGRNQFSPSFREPLVTLSVPEDLVVGSVVGSIQAEDRDYGPNGAITYYIIPVDQYLPFSVAEASGLLTLSSELDFETVSTYHLQIRARDGGWVSKSSMLNVTVVVMDVNDNPPVFPLSEYTASVPENSEIGKNVIDVKATDADSGANAQITYSLIAGHVSKFAINLRNGTITTLDVFDYEQEQIFDITVNASNTGGHTSFSLARVVIQISDVNEFMPTFGTKQFNFSVSKNVPVGTGIGKVTAVDDDRGSGGQVFYLVFGQNKHMGFEINRLSGEIYTTGSLRKQVNSDIVLKVLARNSGIVTGLDVDETLVNISVIDMNDAPDFTSALYLAHVPEDSLVGTPLMNVSAVDRDLILDRNRVFYSIENGNTNFSFAIDRSSGVILVNSPLDRELSQLYNLTVTATDDGSPPATGTTNVIVTIDDVNDNAPKLTITETQVKENQPQGTIVAMLTASDSDLPPNQGPFTYWLVHPSTAFSLTPDGVLFTAQTIDREQSSAYRVLVAVGDAGIPLLSSTTMIYINILDENDNPPLPRNIFIEVKYFGSYFQGGMIGNVHPEDQDESDEFNCAIRSGPLHMFTIANGTCELWSSPFQGEATFNVTVEATDRLHSPVNNSIYVKYKGFTNASIDSSIFFYVSSSSMEEFLSYKYLRLMKALDSLQASKTHVFGIKHIGSEILLLAAVKNYNGQYLSGEVAGRISAGHKKLLEAQSNVTISHITSDPCLVGPCLNGARCNKNIHIGQDVAVLESTAVIFVSPQKEVFNCTCPAGLTGTLCEDDIDECEGNPCDNEGTCVNTPGGFYCHCQSGFSGSMCTTNVNECLRLRCQNGGTCVRAQDGYQCRCVPGFEGDKCEQFINHCRSAPCVQGKCINSQAGFSCQCPFGVSGDHCEEPSYGFEELSFIEFPPLDRRINLISLEFATLQRNALLLYNPGGLSSREFFALEILDGSIHLSYDLGSGPVRLQTDKQVTDGYFHSVTARRIGNVGSLHVDNCTDVENNGFCFSQNDGGGLERTLDVGSNVTFGGLRTFESILLHPAQIKTHDFIGCIRNIHTNGIQLRPSMALETYNVLDKCPRETPSPCHSNPCKNGSVCHDLWSRYFCECKGPLMGSNCTKEMSEELVLRFNGNDYVEYVIKERFKRDYLLKVLLDDEKEEKTRDQTAISIKFKTQNDGVLMVVVGRTGYVMLKIDDRKPVYISEDTLSGHLSEFSVDSPIGDGHWHVLLLSSNGQNTSLFLDGAPALNITDRNMDITPARVEKIVFGSALADDSKLQQPGFMGCVQYFNVTCHPLPASLMGDVWPSSTLVQSSCSSPDVCLPSPCSEGYTAPTGCLSERCQNRRRCGSAVQNRSCICLHNASDHACDICISGSHDRCSEAQGGGPLWPIAVTLPLISFLVIIGMMAALYRTRRRNAKYQRDGSPPKPEQGRDGGAFCFDGNANLTRAASTEKETQHDPVSADEGRLSVGFHCDAGLSSVQPLPNSELEYYEIGDNSRALCSGTAPVQLSRPKFLSTKYSEDGGDMRRLLEGLNKDGSSEETAKSLKDKPSLTRIDATNSQHSLSGYGKMCPQPEFLEPVRCLTSEEICKLNTPLEPTMSRHVSLGSRPAECPTTIRASSDGEAASVEVKSGQFSTISPGKNVHEPSSLSGCSFSEQVIRPVSSLFQHTSQSAAGQFPAHRASSSTFEQWEDILNMHLPFTSYAPVFEDIAHLPSGPSRSNDMQSAIEETI